MAPIVSAKGLEKVYPSSAETVVALKGIDFAVQEREFVAIMGPSGAGKTTLLNLVGCLDRLSSGKLEVLGKDLGALDEKSLAEIRRRYIGFVFQEFFFIPTLTALENVMLPTVFLKKGRSGDGSQRAMMLLDRVGLKQRVNHFPRELSGGECQRVALARALVNSPKIVLADEPTGHLDTKNAKNIFDLFRAIQQEEGVTVMVATHNVQLGHCADRVIHLAEGGITRTQHCGSQRPNTPNGVTRMVYGTNSSRV